MDTAELASDVMHALEKVAPLAGPFLKPLGAALALCMHATESLITAKANENMITLLIARVSSVQNILKLIESILEKARKDAAVHGLLKPALKSSVAALQCVSMAATKWTTVSQNHFQCYVGAKRMKEQLGLMHNELTVAVQDLNAVMTVTLFLNQQDAPAHARERTEEVRQAVANAESNLKASLKEHNEELMAQMAFFGQAIDRVEERGILSGEQRNRMEEDLAFLVDAFRKGLLSFNDPDSRELMQKTKLPLADQKAINAEAALLGEGGSAKLYKGTYLGQEVAVKVPNYRQGPAGEQDVVDLQNEAYMLAQMTSPHVVKILEVVEYVKIQVSTAAQLVLNELGTSL
eukprot:gene17375-23676_t